MADELDTSSWSGEGSFTQLLVDWLTAHSDVVFLRVEDAKAARADVSYNFISNEIFLNFRTRTRIKKSLRFGLFPITRTLIEKLLTIEKLEFALAKDTEIGSPDYADEGMIQYLHTERIIPPYQTKGYKLIELVRIYEVGTPSRA
jgi:hypothetical protein